MISCLFTDDKTEHSFGIKLLGFTVSQVYQLSSPNFHPSDFSVTFREFNDAWKFHEGLHNFDVCVSQLSSGRFFGRITDLITHGVKIEKHLHDSQLRLEGCSTHDWSFGIPIQPLYLLFDHRYLLDDCYLLIAPPNASFTIIQKSIYELYVIRFSENYFAKLCDQYHLPEPQKFLLDTFNRPSAVIFSKHQQQRFGKIFGKLFSQMLFSLLGQSTNSVLFLYSLINLFEYIEERVVHELILVLARSQQVEPKRTFVKRLSHLRQAEEFIRTHAKTKISIADVSEFVGVSKRTLEYIFKDYYGISPCAYLKCHRLNQLRQSLYSQYDQATTINRLSSEWGFWHTGQLAKDYYSLFGELPSQTVSTCK